MAHKKSVYVLCALVFLLFFLNWNYVQAEGTVISGKLKKINRNIQIAMGAEGNAVVVWNYNKANKAKFGKIYLVELNRVDTYGTGSGTWEAGDPQLVSRKGQRPSVTYLPSVDQYAIVWDTGLAELTDYEKNQKATKIQGCRYAPSYGDKLDTASSFTKIDTIVDNDSIVIGPKVKYLPNDLGHEVKYLHPDQSLTLCLFLFSEAITDSNETTFYFHVNRYDPIENWKGLVFTLTGAYCAKKVIFWNHYIWVSWIKFLCGNKQETASGLLRICKSFTYSVFPIGITPGIFYRGAALPLPLNGMVGCATDVTESVDWSIMRCDPLGEVEATYPFPFQGLSNADSFNSRTFYSPLDNAKKSDSYIVCAQKKGKVEYFNVSEEGEPGKTYMLFKTKKDRVGDMDVKPIQNGNDSYIQDINDVLMVYSEYKNKRKTKSSVKLTTFEVK